MSDIRQTARWVAAQVIERVLYRGSYASAMLDVEINRAGLQDARDAALATEIVYGSLRALPAIDALLASHLRKPLSELEPLAHAVLISGAYQLHGLTRVPNHAVVSESVSVITAARGKQLGGLTNAVLRKISRAEVSGFDRLVLPRWLEKRLRTQLGDERLEAWLSAPRPGMALRASGVPRDELIEELREARPSGTWEAGQLSPTAIQTKRVGDVRSLGAYAAGQIAVQEESAQACGHAVGAQPGERVLDACAGRGGKTALLAEAVGPSGTVAAVDIHVKKLARIGSELGRLGLSDVTLSTLMVDLREQVVDLGEFDRVLVDVPCTGLGTVLRRPEILLRTTEEDIKRMATLQLEILTNASASVRVGGTLTYAVCSPMREEMDGTIEGFQALRPGFEPEGPVTLVGPWIESSLDAFQWVTLKRTV